MAKPNMGILGSFSGKIGPVVGGVWNGIPFIREAPKKKRKGTKRSAARIANEEKMKFTNKVLVPFHPFINIGFQHLAIEKTAISVAYSMNFHQAIIGEYPNLEVDYSKLVISKGNLQLLGNPAIVLTTADTLDLSWEGNNGRGAAYNDQVMLAVYSPELDYADGFVGMALRRDLHYSFKLNPNLTGKTLEVYVGLISFNRKKISDSLYLGRITP